MNKNLTKSKNKMEINLKINAQIYSQERNILQNNNNAPFLK